MRYTDAWLDELRSRVDIVDIVGGYVPLKQKGRRFWACCPFHSEKTPSFSVDSSAQMYYCFGCHKGGNAIHFVMEMDRLDFPEAVAQLAERAHMPLPESDGRARESVSREEKDRIREANLAAARFYHAAIWQSDGAEALTYLHKRGLTDGQIKRFGLGSTAKGRDALSKELTGAGYERELLIKAGLSIERDGRLLDMFRDRAIFPIIDGQGHVLGFGGRILGAGEPKYLNTADTPVFNKRRNLYAMNFARKERGLTRVVLAEGYMDVIALRCAGIPGVVATLGTALTEEQARVMKRMAPEVWVSYDGDSAGRKAALRALDIFEQMDVQAKVIDYPEGMDPDDFVRERGAEGFEALSPLSAAEYRMARAMDGKDMSKEETRIAYAVECCSILRRVKNPVEREAHIRKLEIATGFSRQALNEQMGVVQNEAQPARTVIRRTTDTPMNERAKYESMLLTLLAKEAIPGKIINSQLFSEGLAREMAKLLLSGAKPASVPDRLELDGSARDEAVRMMNIELLPDDPAKALEFAQGCIDSLVRMRRDELYAKLMEEYTNATGERRAALRDRLASFERGDSETARS